MMLTTNAFVIPMPCLPRSPNNRWLYDNQLTSLAKSVFQTATRLNSLNSL
jgi:hypothetical protein